MKPGVLLARRHRSDLVRASRSIPSPVSAETATKSPGGVADARQVRFISHQNPAPLALCALHQSEIVRVNGRGQIQHYQRHVGIGHGLITALDTQRLHQVLTGADAGRVHEFDRDSLDGRHLRHQIARGAGDVGHNRPILLQQPVEQAALADVRAARRWRA